MKKVGSFTVDDTLMSEEDKIELEIKIDNIVRKRSHLIEGILEKMRNEPWYDKVRRNLNITLCYKIWLNPFYDAFSEK